MRPVRFVALSEDGQALVLADEVGRLLALPLDERISTALHAEPGSGPATLSVAGTGNEPAPSLSPRDIQARIRAGETPEQVAAASGTRVERIMRFAHPVLQERARVAEQGLTLETLTGEALTPATWDLFYPFYRSTVDKRWGSAYLRKRFFHRLGETMADRVVLVMARHGGRYVGGALKLLGGDTLYGRVWGCRQPFEFLHFEACYYQAIEFAIAHGLARVEAGAQGPHKLQRGYEPVPTYSAHWIREPGFRAAVERFLAQERTEMTAEIDQLRELLPYRQS